MKYDHDPKGHCSLLININQLLVWFNLVVGNLLSPLDLRNTPTTTTDLVLTIHACYWYHDQVSREWTLRLRLAILVATYAADCSLTCMLVVITKNFILPGFVLMRWQAQSDFSFCTQSTGQHDQGGSQAGDASRQTTITVEIWVEAVEINRRFLYTKTQLRCGWSSWNEPLLCLKSFLLGGT